MHSTVEIISRGKVLIGPWISHPLSNVHLLLHIPEQIHASSIDFILTIPSKNFFFRYPYNNNHNNNNKKIRFLSPSFFFLMKTFKTTGLKEKQNALLVYFPFFFFA